MHDLDFEAIRKGEKSKAQMKRELKGIAGKARSQVVKDYIAWPLMSGLATAALDVARGRRRQAARSGAQAFRSAVTANFTANAIRNVWSYAIIFCGHFPDQTYTFSEDEVDDEERGAWYVRQLRGRREHRGQSPVPRDQREPRLPGRAPPVPRHAQHALRRDRATGEGHLRALRPPVQHGPVPAAARHGAAHDPAARVSRRTAAAEARALPRRRGVCRATAASGNGRVSVGSMPARRSRGSARRPRASASSAAASFFVMRAKGSSATSPPRSFHSAAARPRTSAKGRKMPLTVTIF